MTVFAPTDWRVVGVEASRQSDLQARFDLQSLADRVSKDAIAVDFLKERGKHEAKGFWRPTFTLEVPRQLFDHFFNNPCGYRGHYLASPGGLKLEVQHLHPVRCRHGRFKNIQATAA